MTAARHRRRCPEQRTTFTLKIEGMRGADSVRHLRALLKRLLREHHFRAIDVREEIDEQEVVR
jgi:hypothetical protein